MKRYTTRIMTWRMLLAVVLLPLGSVRTNGQTLPVTQLAFRMALNRVEPTSVTVNAGTYHLEVENAIFLGQWSYVVKDSQNHEVVSATMPRRSIRSLKTVTLAAGTYQLLITTSTTSTVTITVQ